MAKRKFIYIDGESHFIRTEEAWRTINGRSAQLASLRYKSETDSKSVLLIPKAKVFWTRRMDPASDRATYFTAASCDANDMHAFSVSLRSFELEPHILKESSQLASHRKNVLNSQKIIEKPKGVDISLAVRMLEDAYKEVFDVCHLYTSDVDFIPVIQAIRSRGKNVVVYGYSNVSARHKHSWREG